MRTWIRHRGLATLLVALVPAAAHAIGGVGAPVGPPRPLGPANPTWSEPTPASEPTSIPEGEEPAIDSPDGHSYTRSTFPAQLFRRGLVLPRGLTVMSANVNGAVDSAETLRLALAVAFGLSADSDLTIQGTLLHDRSIGAVGYHQFTRNVAVALRTTYFLDEGAPTHPASISAGLGVPIKFRVPRLPMAVRAFDSLVSWYSVYWAELPDSSGQVHQRVSTDRTVLVAPVSLEASPTPWLSFVLAGNAMVYLGGTLTDGVGAKAKYGSTESVGATFSVLFTGQHADLSFGFGLTGSYAQVWTGRVRAGVTMTFRP
jgi:hypothetical protein